MKQVHCDTIMTVLEVWDRVRFETKNCELGTRVLNHLFEIQPKAKLVFGYNKGEETGLIQTAAHASSIVDFFDSVFQLIGPDVEFTEAILAQVAAKHKARGVTPSLFPYLGEAFVHSFETLQGYPLSPHELEAWQTTYDEISNEIIKNLLAPSK